MSVSDPLIKDIKGCTLKFLNELNEINYITEKSGTLLRFCQIIEKIFYMGLKSSCSTLGFIKSVVPWTWLEELGEDKHHLITFPYKNSLHLVKELTTQDLTHVGKFRLLIRHFLVNKCLHIPLEYLLKTRRFGILYKDTAILGDEILLQILLSVLMQYTNITFKLDLKNSTFLDISWRIPELVNLELVPSESLGLSVSFAGEKAVIVGIRSNSVISETGKAEIGDILDNLNGVHISLTAKGKLQSIFNLSKGKPINCTIIKAVYTESKEIYVPIVKLLKQIHVDPDILNSRLHKKDNENTGSNIKKASNGFRVKYIGNIDVGNRGDVKLIEKSARNILSSFDDKIKFKSNKIQDAYFEVGEMGVKILNRSTCEVLFIHSYMEIASCGSVQFLDNYFAYVAGDESCNTASKFTCYLFSAENNDTAFTILQSIGQGFHRTHFAV